MSACGKAKTRDGFATRDSLSLASALPRHDAGPDVGLQRDEHADEQRVDSREEGANGGRAHAISTDFRSLWLWVFSSRVGSVASGRAIM